MQKHVMYIYVCVCKLIFNIVKKLVRAIGSAVFYFI